VVPNCNYSHLYCTGRSPCWVRPWRSCGWLRGSFGAVSCLRWRHMWMVFSFCNPLELDLHGFALLSPVEQLLSPVEHLLSAVEHLLPHSLSCYEQQPCRYRWTRRTRIRPEYDKEAHYNIEKMKCGVSSVGIKLVAVNTCTSIQLLLLWISLLQLVSPEIAGFYQHISPAYRSTSTHEGWFGFR
jgi:hypothetical protein